jgi:hypothetical protein
MTCRRRRLPAQLVDEADDGEEDGAADGRDDAADGSGLCTEMCPVRDDQEPILRSYY